MSKFKIGDRVKLKSNGGFGEHYAPTNSLGTISALHGHGAKVELDKGMELFFYWKEIYLANQFPIHSGDYINSREFTREECERFCELAVECGFGRGEWMEDYEDNRSLFLQIFRDELYWCGDADFGAHNATNITTQFREFLDKEKSMKQFTKDDLKDGMRIDLRYYDSGIISGNSIERLHCDIRRHGRVNAIIGLSSYLSDLTTGDEDFDIIRVTDRDGTVLFERKEKRKVTFELTEEQERELRKQLGQ